MRPPDSPPPPRRRGRPPGSVAQEKNDAEVHFRCRLASKRRWVRAARRQGLSLAAWIIETLDIRSR